jgi:hypothetical protein
MSTWLVEPTIYLPTRELVAACAAEDVQVSATQLARWAKYGLTWPSQPRSRGHAQGVDWVWPLDTIQRPILIARTLQDGDKSLERAARVLLGAGLAVRSNRMREILRSGVDRVEYLLMLRRTYLKDASKSKHDKHRTLTRSLQKAYAGLPKDVAEALIDSVLAIVDLHSLPNNSHAQMGRYLRPEGLRRAIAAISDKELSAAYKRAIDSFPLFPLDVTLFILTTIGPLLQHASDKALVEVSSLDLPYTLGSLIYPPVRSSGADRDEGVSFWEQVAPRHLLTTLWNVLVSYYGEQFTQAVGTGVHDVVDGVFNLNAMPHDLQTLAPDGGLEPAS